MDGRAATGYGLRTGPEASEGGVAETSDSGDPLEPDLTQVLGALLAEIEREPVPDRLLALAHELQAALRARSALNPSSRPGASEPAPPQTTRPSAE